MIGIDGHVSFLPHQKKKKKKNLLLADDRRGTWQSAPQLASLWHRLRLLVITQLWTAYCTSRAWPDRQVTPAHIAARVLAAARELGCAATGSLWDQTSGCGQECSVTGSEGGSRP